MTTTAKPQAPSVQIENIPAALRDVPRWVGWQYRWKEDKWDKFPVCCTSGGPGRVNDPATWTDFETAIAYYQHHHLSGVGFVLTAPDGLCGIDLDHCRDPETGRLKLWAWDVLKLMRSYAEVSPSGTGIRLFVYGTPAGRRRKKGDVELYNTNKYLTTTGVRLAWTPPNVENRQAELDRLYAQTFGEDAAETNPERDIYSYNGLTDHEIIIKASQAKNRDKFSSLWEGDHSQYPSPSEADLALCRLFAFWVGGPDAARVDALFRQSALSRRRKWLERADYRQATLQRAIEDQVEYFRPEDVFSRASRVNRLTQPLQANSAQDTPAFGEGSQEVNAEKAESNSDRAELSAKAESGEQETGVVMATDLAERLQGVPDWRAAFDLARRLHSLTDRQPEQFKKAVIAFCEKTGRPVEAFWLEFLVAWDRVRVKEGDDVFSWAMGMAEQEPYKPTPSLTPLYEKVASIAWHLSRFRGRRPFWLPQPLLALLLNTYPVNISRVVHLLMRYGVIRCVDEEFFTKRADGKRKAKEYIFTGPPPASHQQPAA